MNSNAKCLDGEFSISQTVGVRKLAQVVQFLKVESAPLHFAIELTSIQS